MPLRPSMEKVTSVPFVVVMWTRRPDDRASATARERRLTSEKSALIVRVSMSSVIPGMVAARTPLSHAAWRASV
jgi:hypothetical protein